MLLETEGHQVLTLHEAENISTPPPHTHTHPQNSRRAEGAAIFSVGWRTLTLNVVLCGCETWFLTLHEEHRRGHLKNLGLSRYTQTTAFENEGGYGGIWK